VCQQNHASTQAQPLQQQTKAGSMQIQLPTQQGSKPRETHQGRHLRTVLRLQRSRRQQQGQMVGSQQTAAAQMTAAAAVMMTTVCRRHLSPSFDVAAPPV
jgi:hypothetical protein